MSIIGVDGACDTPFRRSERSVGAEFEFCIVPEENGSEVLAHINVDNVRHLIDDYIRIFSGTVLLRDRDGCCIKARTPSGCILSFEFSYFIIEVSTPPSRMVHEILNYVDDTLHQLHHCLKQIKATLSYSGVHPHKPLARSHIVRDSYYEAVATLNSRNAILEDHLFNSWICSLQTHVQMFLDETINVLNALNATSFLRATMFANSMQEAPDGTIVPLSRDQQWEGSAFGSRPLDVGTLNQPFQTLTELGQHERQRNVHVIERDSQYYAISPSPIEEIVPGCTIQIIGRSPSDDHITQFLPTDNIVKRNYNDFAISRYGTVEVRCDCMQPRTKFGQVISLSLGIVQNNLAVNNHFNWVWRHSARELRRLAIHDPVTLNRIIYEETRSNLSSLVSDLIELARLGLKERGLSEEDHLIDLIHI